MRVIVGRTSNTKLSEGKKAHAYATHAPQHSCPSECPLLRNGCYAEAGYVGIHTWRLNNAGEATPDANAREEAKAIRALPDDPKAALLRLHVVGDCSTPTAASTVAAAAEEWQVRNNAPAYAYTHAWRRVPHAAWRGVSVLASCETLEETRAAMGAGYGAALVVAEHTSDKATTRGDVKVIPCPNQTRDITCADCRLCFNADALRERRAVIAFAAHGVAKKRVQRAIAPS